LKTAGVILALFWRQARVYAPVFSEMGPQPLVEKDHEPAVAVRRLSSRTPKTFYRQIFHACHACSKCLASPLKCDSKALQLCFDRIVPARRELPVKIGKLSLGTAAELSKASELITQKVAEGRLTPGQGQALAELLERRRKIIETDDLERRLQALEGKR
jgi:hypothetical protein